MPFLRSIATIGVLTSLSRVLGFVRDLIIASTLGAGPVADAFFVAFKLPNLFRRLFAEGAFSAAFVPMFAGMLEADSVRKAKAFAEESLSVLLTALLAFVILMQIGMPYAMYVLAPGFAATPDRFDLTIELSRIAFPYLVFVSLVSLLGGVLNSVGRFAAPAASPILLNVTLIVAVLALTPIMPSAGHALAWAVAAAGVVQFVWMLIECGRSSFWLRLRWPRLSPSVKRLLLRAAPVAVGAGIYQINLLVDTIIASWLPTGAISYLFYADRVTQLPLGVVGVAVSTALLPLLVRQVRGNQLSLALHSQNRAVELAFLLTLPAAAALFILAMPIISVLFERGAFGAKETEATAAALAVYATGLPAYVLAKVLTPGFFAREDTVTPVKIALICAILNFILNLLLMGPFLHVGIAIATSVSSWINAALLALVLWRRGQIAPDARLKSRLPRTAMATVAMGLVLALLLGPTRSWLTEETLERTVALGFLIGAGGFTFTAFAYWGGAASPRDLKGLVRGRDVA